MSTAGHPVRGCGCSTRTEPPASSPPAAAIRWPCLCCSQHSGIVATLCVTAFSRMENKMCQPSACLVMILRDLASQPWPCATREETRALLLSAFCPRVFLPAVPPPFAGKGKSCCRPSSQCHRSGAAPGGSGEAGGGCPLLPAPCSAQQGC